MKKAFFIVLILVVGILTALTFTSCSFLFGTQESGTAPEIISVETIKATDGYLESREYLLNQGGTNPMALDDGEEYYVVINYNNPDKMSISYVKINGVKINNTDFAKGSNTSKTYIKYEVEEMASSEIRSYVINSVFYINGTETKKMKWDGSVAQEDKTVEVAVRPSFTLTLDYMNIDNRVASKAMGSSILEETLRIVRQEGVFYNSEMNYYIASPDFSGETILPEKKGGYVFTGWYTKPNGEGELIKAEDKYLFWCNITLFAHYERMFELEIVELDTPLIYEYEAINPLDNSTTVETTEFTSGVIVKNRDFSKNEITHYPTLELPDTIVIEEITYSTKEGNYGLPEYTPMVTSSEYPIIKIDNSAFESFSTLTTVSIGQFVEEIGYNAFSKCEKLISFDFGSNSRVKYIGDYAFESTKQLGISPPFTLPNSVTYLGNFAFRYSGWTNTRNKGTSSGGESVLYVKKDWKYIGYKCFFDTGFRTIIFEPGCYFEDQIDLEEGKRLESNLGYKTIQYDRNEIGASLFACNRNLTNLQFLVDENEKNALNIIPDACFDLFSWTSTSQQINYVSFSEGTTYIGERAFYYQQKIPELNLPTTLEEVDLEAFYENESVTKLTFGGVDSQLKILHSNCFGNLISLDSCEITSSVFYKYGSGIFRGCDRMKCVIFSGITEIPIGYKEDEPEGDDEVVIGHYQSDFLYATGEAGDAGNEDGTTYSSPMRVFCPQNLVDEFKEELKRGKEVHAGNTSSGTSAFSSSVFVHPLENLREYKFKADGEDKEQTVTVAVQEIYQANNLNTTNNVIGYSLVYWSERSEYIKLPTGNDLDLPQDVVEVAMYSIPTSAKEVYVPESYKWIEHDAFNGCTQLYEVEFENKNTLEYIGNYAFFGTKITSFEGGSSLKVIGDYAFRRCTSLRWVDLHDTSIVNTTLGRPKYRDRYKYEYELEDYDRDSNDCLGAGAFQGCTALTWIYLPNNIQQLRTGTFESCKALVDVIIPSESISDETSASSDECFYEYNTPASVFEASTMHNLQIYVNSSALNTHNAIFTPQKNYLLINEDITTPPAN